MAGVLPRALVYRAPLVTTVDSHSPSVLSSSSTTLPTIYAVTPDAPVRLCSYRLIPLFLTPLPAQLGTIAVTLPTEVTAPAPPAFISMGPCRVLGKFSGTALVLTTITFI